ncbi:protein-tyrosine-phosphatase [Kurthia zopfii]|uniref:Protein-tyrosine phosphatase n=1 Tax=Kurthia zopfii TaxID=1650 RepID=A0A8B4QAS8_9BACL|nr:tyrosine-protein phosphatase [Kurthia zopfii]PWI22952.1 hypothetical protein DF281_04725 [Kurthia zopfii]TDR40946.1 protein-tyrosine phosphatase [Kurthia zopfii]GEK30408.1 protein-tyrosine-phosphatase [Kurthia zopfii]STX09778.1 Tyrosine-protein phosphatase precursor [Kurthia zopfii]
MNQSAAQIANFRDMGGLVTNSGNRVKEHLLFRSGELNQLNQNGVHFIQNELNIQSIIDFRDEAETKSAPTPLIDGVKNFLVPANKMAINFASMKELIEDDLLSQFSEGSLEQFYRALPIKNAAYKKLVQQFKSKNHVPLLQHCTAGKDRTGVGAMILYLILDVPFNAIVQEYLLTNDYMTNHVPAWVERAKPYVQDSNLLNKFIFVDEAYLSAAYDEILQVYKTVDQYLLEEFEIDAAMRQTLHQFYTEEVL